MRRSCVCHGVEKKISANRHPRIAKRDISVEVQCVCICVYMASVTADNRRAARGVRQAVNSANSRQQQKQKQLNPIVMIKCVTVKR